MPKEPEHIRKLREYAKSYLTLDELAAIESELYGASDRSSAVILAAITEDSLRNFLLNKMRKDLNSDDRKQLFGFEGALGTFSAKITIAYALQFLGPVSRSDLDTIRFLRNQFAHSRKPMRFDIPEVRAVCAKLQFPDLPNVLIPIGALSRLPASDESDKSNPRTRYKIACHNLAIRFIAAVSPPPDDLGMSIKDFFGGGDPLP
jgi:hypothetical protein